MLNIFRASISCINMNVHGVNMPTKEVCLLRATFFGLTTEYMNGVYDAFFLLKQHGNWGFHELYSLPIKLRDWFAKRLAKHLEERNKNNS